MDFRVQARALKVNLFWKRCGVGDHGRHSQFGLSNISLQQVPAGKGSRAEVLLFEVEHLARTRTDLQLWYTMTPQQQQTRGGNIHPSKSIIFRVHASSSPNKVSHQTKVPWVVGQQSQRQYCPQGSRSLLAWVLRWGPFRTLGYRHVGPCRADASNRVLVRTCGVRGLGGLVE